VRAAVVGHVEWVDFFRVERIPQTGDIVRAAEAWAEPAGGGPVAAAQLAALAGATTLFTALGDDELGHRAHDELVRLGLRVEAVFRNEPQRRAITHIDASGERAITVVGARLAPRASDPLPWEELARADAVYLCAADAEAVRLARAARVLVATSRVLPLLAEAAVELDALVGSARDPSEPYRIGDLDPAPRLVVRTEGNRGGTWEAGGRTGRFRPAAVPGPIADTYGAGDCFAAGLTFALAESRSPADAVAFAARCGAAALTRRGPYEPSMRSGATFSREKGGNQKK
jgi:ribokinase